MSGGPGTPDPGRFACENFDLASLIMLAYDLPSYRLSAPSWMRDAKFDIVANVPSGSTKEQFRLMQQNQLAERFQLKTHWETKEMQVYVLATAKRGPKLKESAAASPMMSIGSTGGITQMMFKGSPVEQFAKQLSHVPGVDLPVLDKTGLTGNYDFELRLARGPNGVAGPEGESVFTAIEDQLGLKLEAQRAPISILVVDKAEKTPQDWK
jgi:uncharacterized protein (TIGR03435 family)